MIIEDYKDIGRRISKIREGKGMTQNELADAANFSTQHISNIERGHTKLGLSALIAIANALNVTTDVILCDSVYASKAVFEDELAELVHDSDNTEIKVMVNMYKTLLPVLRRYYGENDPERRMTE